MTTNLLTHLRRGARLGRLTLLAIMLATLMLPAARPALAASLTVDSTGDASDASPGDGFCATADTVPVCTLRAAIQEANASEGSDTISFNIAGPGVHTITPAGDLPQITGAVTIDGLTQPGASCAAWPPTLQIELRGPGAGNGLNFQGFTSNIIVRGLVINSFQLGIEMAFATGTSIECNFIGTDPTGTLARPNTIYGIQMQQAASGNTIGGPLVSQRNLIASNGTEIGLDNFGSKPSGNTIQNNYIGTDVTGSVGLGTSQFAAIYMYGSDGNSVLDNLIYSSSNAAINARGGINISGDGTRTSVGNIIQGNVIGVAASGQAATGSVAPAINLYPSDSNPSAISGTVIGGTAPGQGNLLSGNTGEGIYAFASSTTIRGNLIGTQAGGTGALGNRASGITIDGSNNIVGGTGAGEPNVIASNGGSGVSVRSGSGNSIRANKIYGNAGLGIDLGADGVTFNHAGPIAGPNSFQNYPVLNLAISNGSRARVAGTLSGAASTPFSIDVYANPSCDPTSFGEGQAYLGSFSATTNVNGLATFDQILAAGVAEPAGISATATGPQGTSEFSYCRPVATPNLNWVQALAVPTSGSTTQQYITDRFQEKWFKFPVQPGGKVRVTLASLPGSAISLHTDPLPIYNGLTNPQSAAVLSAEAADTAFLPSGSLPSGSLPSGSLPSGSLPSGSLPSGSLDSSFLPSGSLPSGSLPSGSLPSGSLPSGSLPSGSLPSGSLPSGSLPSGSLPSGSLPSGSLPSGSLPSGSLPSGSLPSGSLPSDSLAGGLLPSGSLPSGSLPSGSLDAYASAARRSLLGVAMDPYATVQTIVRDTYDTQGDLYVRVVGPYSLATPFSLQVTVDGGVCGAIQPVPANLAAVAGVVPSGAHKTLILTHSGRLPGSPAEIAAALADLRTLAARADVDGVLIDLADATYPRVAWANAQADANPTCPAAKNTVAAEIKAVIDAYRTANGSGGTTTLQYIVLAGGAGVIPFYQVQDVAGLASEKEYVAPVAPLTPSEAGLRSGLVQGQDYYGSQAEITQAGNTIAMPGLAVGRLVDNAADVSAAVRAYIATNGVVAPRSALVTGYDFVGDAAAAIKTETDAGTGTASDALIQRPGLPPTDPTAWTADQLRGQLLGKRHDIAVLSGHFSAGSLLAADYRTQLSAAEVAGSTANLTNTIVLALGCHGGYSIPAGDLLDGASPNPDWAKAFLRRGAAGFVAATGYAYGDTDLTEYGERLFVGLAQQLRTGSGSVALGQALVAAKRQYLAETAQLTGIDAKTIVEMTLYGLPMMKVNMPGARINPQPEAPIVSGTGLVPAGTGATSGLSSTAAVLNPAVTTNTKPLVNVNDNTTITATYLSGADGVIVNPYEPIYPKDIYDVSIAGQVLRGVAFRGGSYTDQAGVVPLTSAPGTETSTPHQSFNTDVFYPNQTWLPNFYDAIGGGATRLVAIPAQFRSRALGAADGTLRTFSRMNMQLYYLPANWTAPSSPASVKAAAISAAPVIQGASALASGGSVTFSVNAQADGSAGVQAVWVLYTGAPGSQFYGQWLPLDLSKSAGDPTLWTGTLTGVTNAADLLFMVQAVGGAGLTTLATNLGAYYRVTSPGTVVTEPAATTLALISPPASGVYLKSSSFTVELKANGVPLAGQSVTLDIGGQQAQGTTGADGRATISLKPVVAPGSYAAQASFRGGASYASATASSAFTLAKDTTSLAVTPASASIQPGQPTPFVAALRDSSGRALGGKSIVFVIHSSAQTLVRSAIADYQGNAPLGALALPNGSYTVDAYFGGSIPIGGGQTLALSDEDYASSSQLGGTLTIGSSADTTPPATNLTTQPPTLTNSSTATFTFTGTDTGGSGVSGFLCSLDGAPFTSCTSPQTYTGLADGSHIFKVQATDAAGNADPNPAIGNWTVDTAAPETLIINQPPATSNSASASFEFSSTEEGSTLKCSLDGAAATTCTSPKTYTGLADGNHTFTVQATDAAGNIDTTPASYTWKIDTVTSVTIIDGVPPAVTNSTSASLTFHATKAGATFACSLDAAAFATCTSPKSYAGLADGNHTFQVRATDSFGVTDPTPASYTWVVDTGAPDTNLTSTPPALTNSSAATFTFDSSEANGSFACKLDGAAFVKCASPLSVNGLADGSHTLTVQATDAAGNPDPTPASYSWAVDTTPPTTAISAGPASPTSSTSASFSMSSNEPGATFECSLDGAAFVACPNPQSYAGLASSLHTFQARATDAAGNTDPNPASYSWTIDTSSPITTITSAPPATTRSTSASFSFTATKAGSTFECKLDTAAFAACASSKSYTGLAAGTHTFQVRSKDPLGNLDPSPATYTWTIDLTPPDTTISASPANPTTSTAASFSFASTEVGSTFECKLDTAAFAACASSKSYTGLALGAHTFQVRATDAAGNTDPSPASYTWTIKAAYTFDGFFRPVSNPPAVNRAKAGSIIPVRFSLGGNFGANIFAPGYPQSQPVACGTGPANEIDVDETETPSFDFLIYNQVTKRYIYLWKTDQAWAGTCRQLIVKFSDGSAAKVLNFRFVR